MRIAKWRGASPVPLLWDGAFGRQLILFEAVLAQTFPVARTAKIAASVYPQSDTTNGYYAISLALLGKMDEALQSLKKAAAISSKGIGSAAAQNQIALALAGANKLDTGIEWLKIAIEMYPKEVALYGTLGDFYLKQNRREEAINAYKRALDVDPNFEHAKEMLKKLME